MKRVLDLLASLRLTLVLLALLAALFLAGLAIPQKELLQRDLYRAWQRQSPRIVSLLEAADLTDIYRSRVAKGLWLLFFANLAVVMIRRIPTLRERIRIDRDVPDPASAPGFSLRREMPIGADGLERVGAYLRSRRFAVVQRDGRIRAVRNRFAPLATLAFHLSFFLVAAGGYVSVVTRFHGDVDLGEGERFTGMLAQYVAPPRLPEFGAPPRVGFVVESIQPQLERDVAVGIRVVVRDDRMLSHVIEVNHPYQVGDASFVFKNLGAAPLLVVQDTEGRELFGGYVRLDLLRGHKDAFTLMGRKIEAQLFPDYVEKDGDDGTRSRQMRAPALRLTLASEDGGAETALLRRGDTVVLGPWAVVFADWRYWVRLYVRSERGIWIIWFGFAVAAIAVATRLFSYRREYVFSVEARPGGPLLHVAARSEYYRALFVDEADALLSGLRVAAEAGDARGAQPGPPNSAARDTSGR